MAEADPWIKRNQCTYFAAGNCRNGEGCRYAHGGPVKKVTSPSNIVCRFYLTNECMWGENCRYLHANSDNGKKTKPADGTKNKSYPNGKSNAKKDNKNGGSGGAGGNAAGKMTVLKKESTSSTSSTDSGINSVTISPSENPDKWVEAPEFVPGLPYNPAGLSYSGATKSTLADDPGVSEEACASVLMKDLPAERRELCPIQLEGAACPYGDACHFTHGQICDYCQKPALHPLDAQQNKQHKEECLKEMESDMELSFAIQRSKDKTCGICMEVILEKENPVERRFGLLSDCNHCFCLACIRKWRQAKQFDSKVVRSCPECRVSSDFVTPSKYWADDIDDKKKMIEGYKEALSKKSCRYFDQGRGECPFNEKCFYRHAYPDGRIAEPKPRTRRVRNNSHGDLELLQQFLLWDFLESRDSLLDYSLFDVIDELFYNCSDSESEDDEDLDFLYLHL